MVFTGNLPLRGVASHRDVFPDESSPSKLADARAVGAAWICAYASFTPLETTVAQPSHAREQHSPERNVSALRCDEFDRVLHAVRLFAMAANGSGFQQHESRPHHTAHVRPCCSLRSRWWTDEKHT